MMKPSTTPKSAVPKQRLSAGLKRVPPATKATLEVTTYSAQVDSIETLGRLRQSLLFAELADIAYLPLKQVEQLAGPHGFDQVKFYENDGSQAYRLENSADCVIICRGTEPNEWNDIKADVNALSIVAETIGRVHRGFKKEVDDFWPLAEQALADNAKTLWFTGHSLGGAMATICAGRCFLSHIRSMPCALYTYGSPRVGNRTYINYCDIEHIRWVNNNDMVTRVPPAWFGYRHSGQEMYLNTHGQLRQLNGWQRTKDRFRGFWDGLRQLRIDPISDHQMTCYIESIHRMVLEYEASGLEEDRWIRAKKRWGKKMAKKAQLTTS
jgi:triacylglycerol lipase